jgi:hypothetical protein
MKKFLIILPLIFLAGCEFRYRYECQDPVNWGKAMCNNDECKAEGSCTSDVLGFKPGASSTESPEQSATQDFTESSSQSISNTDCKPPATANTFKPKNTFKPNRSEEGNLKQMKSEEMVSAVQEDFVRTPLTMESEQPLTMNTIVETAGHNQAAKFNKW